MPGTAADTNTIKIGTPGTQTTAAIAGIGGVTIANSAAVLINRTGQIGTVGFLAPATRRTSSPWATRARL